MLSQSSSFDFQGQLALGSKPYLEILNLLAYPELQDFLPQLVEVRTIFSHTQNSNPRTFSSGLKGFSVLVLAFLL